MNMNMNIYKYYIAIAVIVITVFYPVFDDIVKKIIPDEKSNLVLSSVASVVTFAFLISLVDYFDRIILWKFRTKTILHGTWDYILDIPDGDSIYSIVEIRQDRAGIQLNGVSYFDKDCTRQRSKWVSISCTVRDNELTYVYDIKRTKDETPNHAKLGVSQIMIPSVRYPTKLTGSFSDCSPSHGSGSVTYIKRKPS